MKFRDIPKFPFASYVVNIGWDYLPSWLDNHNMDILRCDMDPFYQRGYIWTKKQKIAYLEYQLKGGFSTIIQEIIHRLKRFKLKKNLVVSVFILIRVVIAKMEQ